MPKPGDYPLPTAYADTVSDPRTSDAVIDRLLPIDRDEALAVLSRAFWPDPLFGFFVRDRLAEYHLLAKLFGAFLSDVAPFDESLVARSGERIMGVAAWAPPGTMPRSTRREAVMQARVARLLVTGQNRRKGLALLTEVDKVHPHEPHWYLFLLGTDPLVQGHGVGSRLLAPTLARADDDGVPAYLETQKFENIAFYARHGFTVVHEVTLPGSPTVWAMQRNPR